MDFDVAVGYGTTDAGLLDLALRRHGPNREMHLAFTAESVDEVEAFHAAATELGAETLHAPRLWPEYHEHYYGAFVRDPDGNNVEAVCHTAPAE